MLRSSTSEVFAEACFNTPTFGELYKFAAIDAERADAEDSIAAETLPGQNRAAAMVGADLKIKQLNM